MIFVQEGSDASEASSKGSPDGGTPWLGKDMKVFGACDKPLRM